MIVYNNKEYRNLQQQVKENMDDIKQLQNISTAGIKVDYIVDAAEDLADIEDPEAGQMAAVGTEVPYTIYTYYDNAWVNFGEFPMPGPEGPQGPQGERGPQGATGAQGPQGPRGFTGAQGNTGPKGDKGDTGAAGRDGTDGISPVITMQSPSVTTLEPGESATATVTVGGTASEPTYKFEFGIPRGQDGSVAGTISWGQIDGDINDQADLLSKFSEYALLSDIPTKTSQLQNDDGFITSSALSSYATINSLSSKLGLVSSSSSYNRLYAVTNAGNQYMADIARDSSVPNTIVQRNNLGHIYAGDLWDSFNGTEAVNGNWVNQTISSSLVGYATQSWVSSQGYLTSVPSEYATQSWVNNQGFLTSIPSEYATISQVSSAISALDYASVGALSSDTYIPRVGGDNDGSYWTEITLGDDTYAIPQGGVSSVAWGDISGTLSNQTDLQTALDNKLDKEVTAGDDSSYIDINETAIGLYVDGLGENDEPVGSYLETSKDGIVIQANNTEGQSTQLIVSDGSVTITRDSDSASIELFDLASMSYVDDSISALSSIYAPVGDYATNSALSSAISSLSSIYASQAELSNYALLGDIPVISGTHDISNWTTITINDETYNIPSDGGQTGPEWGGIGGTLANQTDLMSKFSEYATVSSLSEYAKLSASQSFTANQYFSTIYTRHIRTNTGSFAIGLGTSPFASAYIKDVYAINTLYLSSGSATATSPRIYGSAHNIYLQTGLNGGHIYFSEAGLSCALSDLALKSEIPSLSEYATISALSSAISDLSSVYAPLSDYASTSYVGSAIASLSSVYVQPSQLASVATTGSYNDLEDKPETEPKYVHHLTMFNNATVSSATLRATTTIITNSPDVLTVSALRDYLYENGYNTVANGIYEASGAYYESSSSFAVLGIRATSATGDIDAVVPKAANVYSIPHVIKVVDIVEPLAEALGISLDWSDITNKPAIYYNDGDTFVNSGYYNANGYLTSGGKEISFLINTPKLLTNITSIDVNHLNCLFRGVGGYVNGNSAIDYANTTGYTVTAAKSTDNAVIIQIVATAAYGSGTNNTPINIAFTISGLDLTFNS